MDQYQGFVQRKGWRYFDLTVLASHHALAWVRAKLGINRFVSVGDDSRRLRGNPSHEVNDKPFSAACGSAREIFTILEITHSKWMQKFVNESVFLDTSSRTVSHPILRSTRRVCGHPLQHHKNHAPAGVTMCTPCGLWPNAANYCRARPPFGNMTESLTTPSTG
ncbi:hypothetical protein JI742_02720 [Piscinibacter sp. Jin2]|uniref:Uncharacterized protein n=1 Tax=Aquariibacter lacus TaxID=2801332 RepID=A0A9X0XC40_9BURK|nr:hypothetical protein [Piscinibacter lacus]